jgi:hypothetical protein
MRCFIESDPLMQVVGMWCMVLLESILRCVRQELTAASR